MPIGLFSANLTKAVSGLAVGMTPSAAPRAGLLGPDFKEISLIQDSAVPPFLTNSFRISASPHFSFDNRSASNCRSAISAMILVHQSALAACPRALDVTGATCAAFFSR